MKIYIVCKNLSTRKTTARLEADIEADKSIEYVLNIE
mgnify:CR=1 FL=1